MEIICLIVTLLACTLGSICGMGGGVIIKPVLDALGLYGVSTINFLSGCTVLGMSSWSVFKTLARKESVIKFKTSTSLALGAAAGGITGKQIYGLTEKSIATPDMAGGIQAAVLFIAVLGTFIYTVNKDKIKSKTVTNIMWCVLIGFLLGNIGAFLGIGGGPFNVAVLYYFFSMDTKTAAQNSLYVIVFSQAAGLMQTAMSNKVPDFDVWILIGMILCGVIGSEIGRRINKGLSDKKATQLLEGVMILIMLINVYNIIKFIVI